MAALTMPDVEEMVWALVSPLGGMHVFAFDSQAPWPYVTESVAVQIDVRASTKKAARDRAYQARNMILDLALDPTNPVAACNILSGPSWLPEQDGAPRYVLRVSVTTRGARNLVEGK